MNHVAITHMLFGVLAGVALLCGGMEITEDGTERQLIDDQPAYHDHLPPEPLPSTLDPAQFRDHREAFVAYSIARRIREVLYQEPCYCPCKKTAGHQSLLDCFTSTHGQVCVTCRKEVLLCFQLHRQRKDV